MDKVAREGNHQGLVGVQVIHGQMGEAHQIVLIHGVTHGLLGVSGQRGPVYGVQQLVQVVDDLYDLVEAPGDLESLVQPGGRGLRRSGFCKIASATALPFPGPLQVDVGCPLCRDVGVHIGDRAE